MPIDPDSRNGRSLVRSVVSRARDSLRALVALLRNRYFLVGIALMAVIGIVTYLVVDRAFMPSFTRYDVSVVVPDVMTLSYDEAAETLGAAGLTAEEYVLRKPNLPRDVVIDQRPPSGSRVKPGRRIYLTINTGDTTTVSVPRVIGLSIREAQSRIVVLGLTVPEILPDSIPASHANTVTRQQPEPGARVPHGADVTLWYSTGLGEAYVEVPDVTGLTPDDARARLLSLRLRSVVLGEPDVEEPLVLAQSPAPGTQVREGFEVRLRVSEPPGDTPEGEPGQ
jgi:beta-lactam-binding protein with PASTA domain